MENTLENFERFASQYWGQSVLFLPNLVYSGNPPEPSHEEWGEANVNEYWISKVYGHFPLHLKPLSAISDKDAIEVGNILNGKVVEASPEDILEAKEAIPNLFLKDVDLAEISDRVKVIYLNHTVDFLRSRGYLLPFNGLSVETIMEYGWAEISA